MPTNRKKTQDDDQLRDDPSRDFETDEEQGGTHRSSQQSTGSNPGQGTSRQGGNQRSGSSNTKKRK
jgi:hypothetical protein